MHKKGFKGRCEKRVLEKCEGVCRTFDAIQAAYAERLSANPRVATFRCNVELEDFPYGDYTSDFVVTTTNGDTFIRECVNRERLMKPMTVRLLDASREYWLHRGVKDWGLVINEEK